MVVATANPFAYLPIATSLSAFAFAVVLYRHLKRSRGARYLLWWTIGVFLFGIGAGTEALTTLLGWQEPLFRAWYITGAILGAAPLAQGTAYLLLKKRTADRLTIFVVYYAALVSVFVLLTPLDLSAVDPNRLEANVMEWTWVRAFSPLLNTYALVMLGGGAALSAWRYHRRDASTVEGAASERSGGALHNVVSVIVRAPFAVVRFLIVLGRILGTGPGNGSAIDPAMNRVWGNTAIATGTLIVGIGGSFARAGVVEVLYVAEVIGLLYIWLGYRLIVNDARPSIHAAQVEAAARR